MPDVPNISYLTMGYNALTADPHDLASTGLQTIFKMDCKEKVDGTPWLKPVGTEVVRDPGGFSHSESVLMKTSYDYSQKSTENVGFSVEVPDVFSFSESVSFSQFREDKGTHEGFTSFTRQGRNSYQASIDLNNPAVKVTEKFERDLKNLPAFYEYSSHRAFVEKWGTHIATKIQMGGMAYMSKRMTVDQFSQLKREGVDIKAAASATYDNIKAGVDAGKGSEQTKSFSKVMNVTHTDLEYVGGNPSLNPGFKNWSNTVDEDPAPIHVHLVTLDTIIDKKYMSEDIWDIENKQGNIGQAITKYFEEEGIPYIDHLEDVVPVYRFVNPRTYVDNYHYRYGTEAPPPIPKNTLFPSRPWANDGLAFLAFKTNVPGSTGIDEYLSLIHI